MAAIRSAIKYREIVAQLAGAVCLAPRCYNQSACIAGKSKE